MEKEMFLNGDFPGPEAKKILRLAKRYYATTTVSSKIVPARAVDTRVWDVDGNEFIDFVSGVGVANCGFNNPKIMRSMTDHLSNTGIINFIHHDFHNPWATLLARRMVQRMESYFGKLGEKKRFKMFFANSGAEIVEAALKLIWAYRPERQKILAFKSAFHGRTGGAMPFLTKEVQVKNYPIPVALQNHFRHLTFPKSAHTFDLFKQEIQAPVLDESGYSAIFLEIIQGEGGLNPLYPPAAEFIQKEVVEKFGIYLVIDEVQTGNGRTGRYFAFEHYPVLKPTIVITAKGAASGMPFGAMWLPEEMDWKEKGRHSSTYGGNALAAVAAGATLDYLLKRNLFRHVKKLGSILRKELLELERDFFCIQNVRGLGLMQGFDVVKPKNLGYFPELRDEIEAQAPRFGLILMRCGEAGIRILPPLVISERDLLEGLARLRQTIKYTLNLFKF